MNNEGNDWYFNLTKIYKYIETNSWKANKSNLSHSVWITRFGLST